VQRARLQTRDKLLGLSMPATCKAMQRVLSLDRTAGQLHLITFRVTVYCSRSKVGSVLCLKLRFYPRFYRALAASPHSLIAASSA
jgi:hypothetical protein